MSGASPKWTPHELAVLRRQSHVNLDKMSKELPGRSATAIKNKCKELRIPTTSGEPEAAQRDQLPGGRVCSVFALASAMGLEA